MAFFFKIQACRVVQIDGGQAKNNKTGYSGFYDFKIERYEKFKLLKIDLAY